MMVFRGLLNLIDMVDWHAVREEFPVCKKYVYLNPAGGSPVSLSAATEGKRFYDEMLAEGDVCWDTWLQRTEEVRGQVARFINADKSEIAFTTNTSTGMNIIARMLADKGNIATMEDEFPSSTFPWINLGVNLAFLTPENDGYPIANIEAALHPEINVLVSSHVQYRTGYRQDLEALGALCKERGIVFVVNATQSLGIFPVDVRSNNIDFLIFTGLKWATAGYGIAGLYINRKFLTQGNFPTVGWRSVKNPEMMVNNELVIKPEASALESGCPHFPNIFALGGALLLFERIGKEQVVQRVLELNIYLERKLKEAGFEAIPPFSEENRSGITIVRHSSPKLLVEELFKRNIVVSARGKGLRVSVSIFNNQNDIDTLVRELKSLG